LSKIPSTGKSGKFYSSILANPLVSRFRSLHYSMQAMQKWYLFKLKILVKARLC